MGFIITVCRCILAVAEWTVNFPPFNPISLPLSDQPFHPKRISHLSAITSLLTEPTTFSSRPGYRLRRWLDSRHPPEDFVLISTALITGVATGLGAIGLIKMIGFFQLFFGTMLPGWLHLDSSPVWVVVLPAIGGLIGGPLIVRYAREAKGHGVPEVLAAMTLRGGRIRAIVAVIKALASGICIGTGGSAGREGPIVQIGAALGSNIGQFLHLSDDRIRGLVACGAAAGISATFNSPIAGAIFAQEIILGEFSTGHFSTVVISSVAASIVSRSFLGDHPAFVVPVYRLVNLEEIGIFIVLGLLAALCAVLFIRVLFFFEVATERWRFPEWAQPAVGGLLLGGLGLFVPQVLGTGLEVVGELLTSPLALGLMVLLIFAKILATSFTLGFGNSGGVFSPSLFMGAMLGGAVGTLANRWFPGQVAPIGAYTLVGMAAVFAASTRASMTAVLIVFEMSNDYRLILPLMAAVMVATFTAERLMGDSIYTIKLTAKGIRLERGRDIDVMQGVLVSEAMTQDIDTVAANMPLLDLKHEFIASHHHGFPVMDTGKFVGIVTLQDLARAQTKEGWADLTVRDIATQDLLVAHPSEPIYKALQRMGARDVGRLPVVSQEDPNKLIGLVRRNDIVRAYQRAILRRLEMQDRAENLRLGKLSGKETLELTVEAHSRSAGKPIKEINLPENCLLISVRRGRRVILLRGDTVLEPGDEVTAVIERSDLEKVRACFQRRQEFVD